MEHFDQHNVAIAGTVKVAKSVSCSIFDDKIQDMGAVTVERGSVTVKIDYLPSLMSNEAMACHLSDAIALAVRQCYAHMPDAFDPHS